MRYLLSIKTVIPKPGGRVWYDDQLEAHGQIYEGDDGIDYAFMGTNPNAADNQWLRAAYENQVGVIYFLGIAPGRYQPIWPVYIADWDAKALKARRATRCAERIAAFQDLSRRLRCLPHRHRSGMARACFGLLPKTSQSRPPGWQLCSGISGKLCLEWWQLSNGISGRLHLKCAKSATGEKASCTASNANSDEEPLTP